MPIWLEITFACLSAFSVVLSILAIGKTSYKNRISKDTITLHDVLWGEVKFEYNDNLIQIKNIKFSIYNNTNRPLLVTQCRYGNYLVHKDLSQNSEHWILQIQPYTICNIDGYIRVNSDDNFNDNQERYILYNSKKEVRYPNPLSSKQ